ncbi:MAG: glycoside hydrolase family 32 protein [Atopobiaceae bacterium]
MTNDTWRNEYHLSPKSGRMNDPCGLCEFKGVYHFFYQLNPEWPDRKAPKCWGHATSTDLVTWKNLEPAIKPDSAFDANGAFSGSAIQHDGKMYLYYTGNVEEVGDHDHITDGRQSSVVMVSTADGRTFSSKKVVLRNADYPQECSCIVRDPKVWEKDGTLYMLLGARDRNNEGLALVYRSADGISWKFSNSIRSDNPFGYMWEAPNRILLDGREFLAVCPQGLKEDLLKFENNYQAGYFWLSDPVPSTTMVDEATFNEWDHGFDFYTPQSFVDQQGRTILVGWLGVPGAGYGSRPDNPKGNPRFSGCLSVPRQLSLVCDEDGVDYIRQWPVSEVEALRGKAQTLQDGELTLDGHHADIVLDHIDERAGSITLDDDLTFSFGNYRATLRFAEDATSSAGRTKRSCAMPENSIHSLRILVDETAVEVYVNDGMWVFSTRWFPTTSKLTISTDINHADASVYQLEHKNA